MPHSKKMLSLVKPLSLAGLLMAAAQSHAVTICSGPCPIDPPASFETLQYTYSGYLTDLRVMAEQALPISLAGLYQSFGVAPGAVVPVSASISVLHSYTAAGTKSVSYNYQVSFGNVSIAGPMSIPRQSYSPFTNDYDNSYDDYGPTDSVNVNSLSYRFTSSDDAVAFQSSGIDYANMMQLSMGDRFQLLMNDTSGQALNSNLPPNNTALDTLFANASFLLQGALQVRDANGVLLPFDAVKNNVRVIGTLSSSDAAFAPTRQDVFINPCGALDLVCGGPIILAPTVPVPGAGLLFMSALAAAGGVARRHRRSR